VPRSICANEGDDTMNTFALKIAAAVVGLAYATATPTLAQGKGGYKDGGYIEQPTWIATYTGADWAKDSFYTYSGAVVSLQRDLSRSGWVAQVFAGYGSYEYHNPSIAGGRVDGDVSQLAAMLGYLWVRPGVAFGLYAGGDWTDHDLTPNDPSNSVRGSEFGLRVGADLRLIGPGYYVSLEGYYSTGFDSYWTRARAGINTGRFIIGPEGGALGNEGFDAQRIGAFVMFKLDMFGTRNPAELTVHGGYQFVSGDNNSSFVGSSAGGEGAYVGFNLGMAF
jgi:hypothetical protein